MSSISHQTWQKVICIATLAVLCLAAEAVSAYKLSSMYVQYRRFENGDSFNRIYFEITDDSGNYIPVSDVVTDVELYHPNGTEANISEITREPDYTMMLGGYNSNNSSWYYNNAYLTNDYHGVILDDLAQGNYRLVVTTDDAQTLELTYQYNQKVDLPIISSSSFEIHPDASGNLFWTWDIPDEACRLSENVNTNLSAFISVYNDQTYVGLLWVTAVTHLGRLYIPSDIVQDLENAGNRFRFGIALRTRDNNNRAYSNGLFSPT